MWPSYPYIDMLTETYKQWAQSNINIKGIYIKRKPH